MKILGLGALELSWKFWDLMKWMLPGFSGSGCRGSFLKVLGFWSNGPCLQVQGLDAEELA